MSAICSNCSNQEITCYGYCEECVSKKVVVCTCDKEFIKGKVLFFIDDIKITGSHERRIKALLESVGFDGTVVFLYYAMYEGEGHPNIENQLNYGFVKQGKDDLLKINSK